MTREEKIKIAIDKGITCDPATGKVYGIRGKEMKSISSPGYVAINICHNDNKIQIYAHQFIYYWIYKEVPQCIDHIKGDKTDNRIENLRSATIQQNQHNRSVAGISWHKSRRKWISSITVDYKSKHLGYFNTAEEARAAYIAAKKELHPAWTEI